MPKVTSFMYAANVIQGAGQGQMHIIAPLQVIVPLYIPSTFSFFVVFAISDFETTKSHNMRVVFKSDKEPVKSSVDSATTIPPLPKNLNVDIPEIYNGFISNLSFQNVVIENDGLYKTTIFFDDEKIGEYEIYVARKKP
jgi:hypothetical protein